MSAIVRRLPVAAAAVTAAFGLVGAWLIFLTREVPVGDVYGARGASGVVAIPFGAIGILIATRRHRNPLGWLFLLSALSMGFVVFGEGYAAYSFAAWAMMP